jgi:lambda repressor-like predicted transcriptional regulator
MVVLTEHLSGNADKLAGLCAQAVWTTEAAASNSPVRRPRQTQRRFTAAEADEIAEQYRAGQTMNQLARTYSVHRRTIAHCLLKQEVPLRQVGLSPEHIAPAATLYRSGWSLARIGDKYGTTDMTVRRALAIHGVPIRPRCGGANMLAT